MSISRMDSVKYSIVRKGANLLATCNNLDESYKHTDQGANKRKCYIIPTCERVQKQNLSRINWGGVTEG